MATQASIQLAEQMYVAYYGRAADVAGLGYWSERFDETDDLNHAINAFGNSAEFNDNYGHLNNDELINSLYLQMFGRDADNAGLEFYSIRLDEGTATLASIAKQIADGAIGDDQVLLDNRVETALCITEQSGDTLDLAAQREILNRVGIDGPEHCELVTPAEKAAFNGPAEVEIVPVGVDLQTTMISLEL